MMEIWSWLLSMPLIPLTWGFAHGKEKRWPWIGGFFLESAWLVYGVLTQQYGFAALGASMMVVYSRNFYRAVRHKRGESEVDHPKVAQAATGEVLIDERWGPLPVLSVPPGEGLDFEALSRRQAAHDRARRSYGSKWH